ncbi:recombinase family protein [Bacillus wiedmannii]|uniref:recombinase family protein n=1 Tax=Bacillus wiedmannii TaxID=1890302 RepID=UPI0021D21CFE|nr:recombinase family protein [Bacillus wiedmannii]MCU5498741.1 recombinase family protein [Bacillus wiedmannii]
MKCVIYRRVSTDMQAEEGFSLEAQKMRLEAYAQSQGWDVVDDYMDDGYSAKNMDRPELQRMLKDARDRKFEIILVYKLDRLCRSTRDLNDMIEEFEENKVKFKSATEVLDTTTATGRLFINLIGTLAQWEREQTAERVTETMYNRAARGYINGGPVPYGYTRDNKKTVINEDEAKIVKMIFKDALSHGTHWICKKLNDSGIKSKTGKHWSKLTVIQMLRNPIYCGYVRYAYTTDNETIQTKIQEEGFTPIISEDFYNKVQISMDHRSKKSSKPRKNRYHYFSTILVCPHCQGKLSGVSNIAKGKEYRYYRCLNSLRGDVVCPGIRLRSEDVDKAFLEKIDIVIDDISIDTVNENNIDLDLINNQLDKLKVKKARIKELYIDGIIDKGEFQKRNNEISFEEAKLIKKTEVEYEEISKEAIVDTLKNLKDNWSIFSDEVKAQAIGSLFDTISIEVTYKDKNRKRLVELFEIVGYKFR